MFLQLFQDPPISLNPAMSSSLPWSSNFAQPCKFLQILPTYSKVLQELTRSSKFLQGPPNSSKLTLFLQTASKILQFPKSSRHAREGLTQGVSRCSVRRRGGEQLAARETHIRHNAPEAPDAPFAQRVRAAACVVSAHPR